MLYRRGANGDPCGTPCSGANSSGVARIYFYDQSSIFKVVFFMIWVIYSGTFNLFILYSKSLCQMLSNALFMFINSAADFFPISLFTCTLFVKVIRGWMLE
jgi:hypothetical protein